jgi:phosphate acetyltransferase
MSVSPSTTSKVYLAPGEAGSPVEVKPRYENFIGGHCPTRWVVYSDCAINPQPDAEDLADCHPERGVGRMFGIEPPVATISFSTGISGRGSDVDRVAEATRIVREREPDLPVDSPLQYGAAVMVSAGRAKRPGRPVAGRTSVFRLPRPGHRQHDVQGRAALRAGGQHPPDAAGPRQLVNGLGPGALVEDIICTIALTAIQARAT